MGNFIFSGRGAVLGSHLALRDPPPGSRKTGGGSRFVYGSLATRWGHHAAMEGTWPPAFA
jgi:hypothetical protein